MATASQVPSVTVSVAEGSTLQRVRPDGMLQVLSPEECRLRAVHCARLADLFLLEPVRADDCLRQRLLALRELELRNRAAGQALEIFYRILESDLRREPLVRQQQALDQLLDQFDAQKAKGLALPADEPIMRRQRTTLVTQRTILERSSERLRDQLAVLTGFSDGLQLSVTDDVHVQPVALDGAEAVEVAWRNRPDLQQVELVRTALNLNTLPLARAVVSAASPGLGAPPGVRNVLDLVHRGSIKNSEVAARATQLAHLSEARRHEIAAEIRAALQQRDEAGQLAALAQHDWTESVARYEKAKQALGSPGVTASEVYTAHAVACQAEHELYIRAVQWKLAALRLVQAQGFLATQPLAR
jgi:hypothetical protein